MIKIKSNKTISKSDTVPQRKSSVQLVISYTGLVHFDRKLQSKCPFSCLLTSVNMVCPGGNVSFLSVTSRVAFRSLFLFLLRNQTAVSRLRLWPSNKHCCCCCCCSLSAAVTLGIFLSCRFYFDFHEPANGSFLTRTSSYSTWANIPCAFFRLSRLFFFFFSLCAQGGRDLSLFVHKSDVPADPKGCWSCCLISAWLQ